MSSKKALRRKQRKEETEDGKRGVSPVTFFIVGIGLAVLVTLAVSLFLGGGSGPGDPPWPGATWSAAHGHWH